MRGRAHLGQQEVRYSDLNQMIRLFIVSVCLMLLCCATNLTRVASSYQTIEGQLVAPPALESGGDRLFLYLNTPSRLVVCLARNRERKEILQELQILLTQSMGHPIFIYASPVDAPIEEILGGVDFEIQAVGVYVPSAGKHRVILTGYGDTLVGAMSSISWADFFQRVIGKGVDAL